MLNDIKIIKYDPELYEIVRFIRKEKHKKYLEIFMVIDEISKNEDIISFTYKENCLIVQTGVKEFYRIFMDEEV